MTCLKNIDLKACFHKNNFFQLTQPVRKVFLVRGPKGVPNIVYLQELEEARLAEEALQKNTNELGDVQQNIDNITAGISDKVTAQLGPEWQKKIVDERIFQNLEEQLAQKEQVSKWEKASKYFKNLKRAGRGGTAWDKTKNYLKSAKLKSNLEYRFGSVRNADEAKRHVENQLIEEVLKKLNPRDLNDIWHLLNVSTTSLSTAPTAQDVALRLINASIAEILKVKEYVDASGKKIFAESEAFESLSMLKKADFQENLIPKVDDTEVSYKFLKKLETDNPYSFNFLKEYLLKDGELDDIAADPKTGLLLTELRRKYEKNPPDFQNYLNQLQGKLPKAETKIENTTETEQYKTKLNKIFSDLDVTRKELAKQYIEARGISKALEDENKRYAEALKASGASKGGKSAAHETAIYQEIKKLEQQKNNIEKQVAKLENAYKALAKQYTTFLTKSKKTLSDKPLEIAEAAKLNPSTYDQLFKKSTPSDASDLEKHILAFDDLFADEVQEDVALNYIPEYQKKAGAYERVSSGSLLLALYDQNLENTITDPNKRARTAQKMIDMQLKNLENIRSINAETAEKLAGGRYRAMKQWLQTHRGDQDLFTGEQILGHVKGLDYKTAKAFAGISLTSSLIEIQEAAEKLPEAERLKFLTEIYLRLEAALTRLELGQEKIVEIADKDAYAIGTLIDNFREVAIKLKRAEEFKKAKKKEAPYNSISKEQIFLAVHENTYKEQEKLEAEIKERLENDKNDIFTLSLMKRDLINKFGGAYQKAIDIIREKKLKGGDAEAIFQAEGLAPTLVGILSSAFATKEIYDNVVNTSKKIKNVLKDPANSVATSVGSGLVKAGRSGKGILGYGWSKLKEGRERQLAKKRAAKKGWKNSFPVRAAKFPFKIAGKILDPFVYKPANDTKKKAA